MARITIKDSHLKQIQNLTLPLTHLKGVGSKRALSLSQKGLHTILDLLFYMPIRYEDRTRISPINEIEEGVPVLVHGKVVFGREEKFYPSRKRLFKILIKDKEMDLELLWFHYRKPHLTRFVIPNTELLAYGSIKRNRGKMQMIHPEITIVGRKGANENLGFYPVYSSVQGISSHILRSLINNSLDNYLDYVLDPIPGEILCRLGLPDLRQAIKHVHSPPLETSIDTLNSFDTPFHNRLVFDRFFLVMLSIASRKRSRERVSIPSFAVSWELSKDLERFFPFKLTSHQMQAIEDIERDFTGGQPMNRLLQGDVGCGKTVVATVAAYMAVQNNRQVAIMVPTQVLANQHMDYFSNLPENMGFRPALLTGSLKEKERRDLYDEIRNGLYNLVIGTHSLIHEEFSFSELSLVIIDEQHRFGVRQRSLMDKKGKNPHLLVMTATPIPRTLAITVYGDMRISVMKEYPRGHIPVETHIANEGRKRWVFEKLRERMNAGQQAFVICPVIVGSEDTDLKSAQDMAKKLRKILKPSFRIGLIHGRLSPDERGKIMDDFRKGLVHLLVGTTVIEVGVHVPRATIMIIEHPERFGLAQLHQLRGRVGRGSEKGICIMMSSKNLSEKALSKLNILADSHDGFHIAQKDLELRGHGELTGMRQAGMGELDFSEMLREPKLLLEAKSEAQRLMGDDPELLKPEHGQLKMMIQSTVEKSLGL